MKNYFKLCPPIDLHHSHTNRNGNKKRRFSQYLDFFFFFAPSDSRYQIVKLLYLGQILKYCPILTNQTSMEILFIQLLGDA